MQKFSDRIANMLRSRAFFVAILVAFIAQGVFFAITVNPSLQDGPSYLDRTVGVVPDGNRHMAAIYHYAHQPLSQGPFITEMTDEELYMGDLVRFPSYLYYYSMSFPVRLALAVGASDWAIILLVRFIGLAFGVAALLVFRRIIRLIGAGDVVANLASLGLAMTGTFAFLAPAENYDILSFLLWLLFLQASITLFVRKEPAQLYWMLVWFCLLSITKYTYLPFMGATGAVAFVLYWWAIGWRQMPRLVLSSFRTSIQKTRRWKLLLAGLLLVVSVALFTERIGVNLVQYQSVSPNCARTHSVESCMNFDVFNRNHNRLQAVEQGAVETRDYEFFYYTSLWLERYYHSTYYNMGHIWVYDVSRLLAFALGVVAVLVAICIGILVRERKRLLEGKAEWFLLGTAVLFIVAQYIFNAQTYIQYSGEMYGHQGRYLLPAVAILYLVMLLIVRRAHRAVSLERRPYFVAILLGAGLIALLSNAALPNFFIHADSYEWFSEAGKHLIPERWL